MNLRPHFHTALRDSSSLGSGAVWAVLTVVAAVAGQLSLSLWLAVTFVAVTLSVIALRALFPRTRPTPRKGSDWLLRLDASSFPSMHATRMGAAAAYTLTLSAPLSWALALLCVWVAASRILLREHHVSDVAAGFALGAGIGFVALRSLYFLSI